MDRRATSLIAFVAIAFVALGYVNNTNLYVQDIVILVLIWALASTAWDLVGGYQNQLALGHSAFFAIGAYTSTLLFQNYGITPWLGVWVGAVLGALTSAFFAWLCLRLKGAFYALATFALSQVAFIVALIWVPVTNGAEGIAIPYVPNPVNWIFDSHLTYLALYTAFLVGYMVLTAWFERSRLGLASVALSVDEDAASALGVRVLRSKVIGAAMSGALTAVAGTAYAQYVLFIHPQAVAGVTYSIQVALLASFGGVATVYGPLLGAVLLIPLSAYLTATLSGAAATSAPGLTNMVYGFILMVTFLFIPRGIGPTAISAVQRFRRPPTPPAPVKPVATVDHG
jgi:branched-chain amino acid transport system permease protein